MPLPDQFIRRYREPYYDSYCRLCTQQAAMAREESGLISDEKNHICDPYLIHLFTKHGIERDGFIERLYKISN